MSNVPMDCCESHTSKGVSRRALLMGGATFAAWAYLPKFAIYRTHGRHPEVRALARLEGWQLALLVILRGSPKRARASG